MIEDEQGTTAAEREDESQSARPVTRARPKNPKELFFDAIPNRTRESGSVLRGHLTGKTAFILHDTKEEYLLDWSSTECQIKNSITGTVDCKITISSQDLMKIASGDLNAQIAMLSSKITIEGRADYAVYVFNLIAPYMH